jgi:hypothetical protein
MKFIVYNKTLNPNIWDSNKLLRTEVKHSLLKIALEFITDKKLNKFVKDILFLGSSANFNWTPTSDVDLHILVDGSKIFTKPELARNFFDGIGKKWNQDNEAKIKGHKVEIYIQDIKDINHSTGVFSVLKNQWIKEATPENIILDRLLIQQKYTQWVNRINKVVQERNPYELKVIFDGLMNMRQTGLDKAGEYSTENIVFKILRQRNFIKKLKDAVQSSKNKLLSL